MAFNSNKTSTNAQAFGARGRRDECGRVKDGEEESAERELPGVGGTSVGRRLQARADKCGRQSVAPSCLRLFKPPSFFPTKNGQS